MRILLAVFLILTSQMLSAQNPRKVSEIYETEIYSLSGGTGAGPAVGETLVPARLIIRPADLNNGVTSITLDTQSLTTPGLYRIPQLSIPAEYIDAFGSQPDVIIDSRQSYSDRTSGIDITHDRASPGTRDFDVTVYDATGKPAQGVTIDVKTSDHGIDKQVLLNKLTVGADGKVHLSLPRYPPEPAMGNDTYTRNTRMALSLTAIDPTGQTQELRFPGISYTEPREPNTNSINLAFVPRDADYPAFRGRILNSEGKPVPNIGFGFNWLAWPGMGGKQLHNGPSIKTAPDGSFSVNVPQDFLQDALGVKSPPSTSTLSIMIGYQRFELHSDRNNDIVLPYTETMQFRLQNNDGTSFPANSIGLNLSLIQLKEEPGKIPDPTEGRQISLYGKKEKPTDEIYNVPEVPLPGLYGLEVSGKYFMPQRLEKGAGSAPITWTLLSGNAEVKGQVLAAEDGTPVEGAYVMESWDGGSPHRLVGLTPEQLESMWAQWETDRPPLDSSGSRRINLPPNITFFNVGNLARTDAAGRFNLQFEPGYEPRAVLVYKPGRIGGTCRVLDYYKFNTGTSQAELPILSLPLSAAVTFSVDAPDIIPDEFLKTDGSPGSTLGSSLNASCGFERPGPWKLPLPLLNPTKDQPWSLMVSTGWFSPGNIVTMPVPAAVKLSITGHAPYKPTVGRVSWKDIGPLPPGQAEKLPNKTISVKIPFLISVKKGDGTPASGISVRIDGHTPITTDASGEVIGWSDGHVGRVEAYLKEGFQAAAKKENITIPQSQEMVKVELLLPQ